MRGAKTTIRFSMCLAASLVPLAAGKAATFTTIYTLPEHDASFGSYPLGQLAIGPDGNLYGTTLRGGASGAGTVFKVTPAGRLTTLHSFVDQPGNPDGTQPYSGVVIDKAGNLYGTTFSGGGNFNGGIVYKLAPDGTETVLHTFGPKSDGFNPTAPLTADPMGNLYGVTNLGGNGHGTIFVITPAGDYKTLHAFVPSDGTYAQGRLYLDKNGNIYGTTFGGGEFHGGTMFRLTPSGDFSVLHNFNSGPDDGRKPRGGLVAGRKGELYGTSYVGEGASKGGSVYRIQPDGSEAIVFAFQQHRNGFHPSGELVADSAGHLYGTTVKGGRKNGNVGVVYKLSASGKETVLHSFTKPGYASFPGLTADASGNLYGVTVGDQILNGGTVFKITP